MYVRNIMTLKLKSYQIATCFQTYNDNHHRYWNYNKKTYEFVRQKVNCNFKNILQLINYQQSDY